MIKSFMVALAVLLGLIVLAAGIVMFCILFGLADYEDKEGMLYGRRETTEGTDKGE